jgi:hypothetical protein
MMLPTVSPTGFLLPPLHLLSFLPVQYFTILQPPSPHICFLPAPYQCTLLVLRLTERKRKIRKEGKMKHEESVSQCHCHVNHLFKLCIFSLFLFLSYMTQYPSSLPYLKLFKDLWRSRFDRSAYTKYSHRSSCLPSSAFWMEILKQYKLCILRSSTSEPRSICTTATWLTQRASDPHKHGLCFWVN